VFTSPSNSTVLSMSSRFVAETGSSDCLEGSSVVSFVSMFGLDRGDAFSCVTASRAEGGSEEMAMIDRRSHTSGLNGSARQ
jgi:hypothetical protein